MKTANGKKIAVATAAAALLVSMASGEPQAPGADALLVMTYNVRNSVSDRNTENSWDARRDALAGVIERENPDVVGFQEVLPDQRAWLEARFPGYEFTGGGRNADRKQGESSPVAYRRDRFEVVTNGTFWLSLTPDVPGSKSWNSAFPRICTYAVLIDRTTGRTFSFANTHTDHRSEEAREKGMLLIIDRMKHFAPGAPIVLVGDHNCLEGELPAVAVSRVLDNAMYTCETTPQGPWRTFNYWHFKENEESIEQAMKKPLRRRDIPGHDSDSKRIDYIYVSPGTRVLEFRTVPSAIPGTQRYPSDHFPSLAKIAFRNPVKAAMKIETDAAEFPEKAAWLKDLAAKLEGYAPKVVELLDGPEAEYDQTITLRLSRKPNVAHTLTGRNIVELNPDWVDKNPVETIGACVHELAHVVQDYWCRGYANPTPRWLSEGIADWVRWCNFEGSVGIDRINEEARKRPKLDASYQITASFLNWVSKHVDTEPGTVNRALMVKLNQACREGRFSEQMWTDLTGKSRLRLGSEWRNELMGVDLDPTVVSTRDTPDILDWVDPFIGSGGTGHTTPAATHPFGMVQPGPDTGTKDWRYCSGYQYTDRKIARFSQLHISGTGCYDSYDVSFMPFSGRVENEKGDDFWAGYRKADEKATPGYYGVTLDNGTKVEMTATRHAAIYRITFLGNGAKLLFDPSWGARDEAYIKYSAVSKMKDNRVFGRVVRKGWSPHDYWFSWEVSETPVSETVIEEVGDARTPKTVYAFDLPKGGVLYLKVSLSRNSADAAQRNVDAEIPGWDFDGVMAQTREKWRELIGRVQAKGTKERLKTLYAAIYHLMFQPNLISDFGEQDVYSTFSCWDTYRAAGPLYTILAPEYVPAFVNSFIWHFDQHGFLPIWTLWDHDNQCMIGVHSIPMLVDAYLKGFKGVDWKRAFECVKASITVNETMKKRWKAEYDILDQYGYYPYDKLVKNGGKEGVSRLLEGNYNDACAARMARGLKLDEDAKFFGDRSHCWTNCYDATTGFIRAKNSKGGFREPFDPFALHLWDPKAGKNVYSLDYCEGNAWHWNWHQMHDADVMIGFHGGPEKAAEKLLELFNANPYRGNDGGDGNESGLLGQYCHGNEPCHHVIYYFTLMGRRDLAAKYAREVAETLYSADFMGLCGNEDCGQMSAWLVFSTMGFYPFDPCGAGYVLGEALLPEISINVGGGKEFRISSGKSQDGTVRLNGEAVKGPGIGHADVMNGGTLEF